MIADIILWSLGIVSFCIVIIIPWIIGIGEILDAMKKKEWRYK